MDEPLISVIVPVYHVERYLDQCVKSIAEQTYINIEIILVDDGSDDHCPEICESWAECDTRIHVIHKRNGGLSDARNAGIDNAAGELIAFVDSDDYILPQMFEKMFESMRQYDSDIAVCSFETVNEDQESINAAAVPEFPYDGQCFSGKECLTKLEEENWRYWAIACGKLYKRCIFEKIRYPLGKINEDMFVIHRIYDLCGRVSTISGSYYKYRLSNDSIMRSKISVKNLDLVSSLMERSQFYAERKYLGLIYHTEAWAFFKLRKYYILLVKDNPAYINSFIKEYRKFFYDIKKDVSFPAAAVIIRELFFIFPKAFCFALGIRNKLLKAG